MGRSLEASLKGRYGVVAWLKKTFGEDQELLFRTAHLTFEEVQSDTEIKRRLFDKFKSRWSAQKSQENAHCETYDDYAKFNKSSNLKHGRYLHNLMGARGSEIAREVANTPCSEVLKRPEVVAARWAKFSSKLSDRVRQRTSHCDSIEEILKLTANGEIGKAAFAYRLIDDKHKAKQILSASKDLGWEDFRLKVNPTKYGDDPKPNQADQL